MMGTSSLLFATLVLVLLNVLQVMVIPSNHLLPQYDRTLVSSLAMQFSRIFKKKMTILQENSASSSRHSFARYMSLFGRQISRPSLPLFSTISGSDEALISGMRSSGYDSSIQLSGISSEKMHLFRTGQLPIMAILSPSLTSSMPSISIDRIRVDSKQLEAFGSGIKDAGIGGGGRVYNNGSSVGEAKTNVSQEIRKDVHQVWLSIPGMPLLNAANGQCNNDLPLDIGDVDARINLCAWVDQLRSILFHGDIDNYQYNHNNGQKPEMISEEERMRQYYENIWGAKSKNIYQEEPNNKDKTFLMDGIDALYPNYVELSYLSYKPGSFYRRHVDQFQKKSIEKTGDHVLTQSTTKNRLSNRVVSFILYLGSDDCIDDGGDNGTMWNFERDGGALRVYGAENVHYLTKYSAQHLLNVKLESRMKNYGKEIYQGCDIGDENLEDYVDIKPLPGTLVLFDSSRVPHAVMEVKRSRRCVVGWFGAPNRR